MNKPPSKKGESEDRDQKGRFKPGSRGGPGNPYVRTTAALKAAIMAAVTEEDIRAIVKKLLAMARKGNLIAMKELLDRAVGRPSQETEVSLKSKLFYRPTLEELDQLIKAQREEKQDAQVEVDHPAGDN